MISSRSKTGAGAEETTPEVSLGVPKSFSDRDRICNLFSLYISENDMHAYLDCNQITQYITHHISNKRSLTLGKDLIWWITMDQNPIRR